MAVNGTPNSISSVNIVLDRPGATYASGEMVNGHCVVMVSDVMNFQQIEIKLLGKAVVEIPTGHKPPPPGSSNAANTASSKPVKYVKESQIVEIVYKPSTVYNSTLGVGRHDIGFSFILPQNIPSSFDAEFGHIRYRVIFLADEKEKAELLLNVVSNPNVTPNDLFTPIKKTKNKVVGLIGGKPVSICCEMPRTGYTLGTQIPIACKINNQSKKSITLKASLKQEITFKATEDKRVVNHKLTTISQNIQLEPRAECNHDLIISVPINLPIVQNTCPIITIQYIASVKLDIPGSFDLHCNMPIILTNQPLTIP